MDTTSITIVFVIGAPGSGKGTLCQRLSEEHDFHHLSIGDMLRDLASSSAADADIVNHVRSGDLIPVEVLKRLLKDRINEKTQHGCRKVLVDGFPRRLDQAAAVEEQIGPPALVLFFHCLEEMAEQRFLTRNLLGRETDDRKTFQKRYQEFTKLNPVIVEAYQRRGILLEINTGGETEVSYQKLVDSLRTSQISQSLARLA